MRQARVSRPISVRSVRDSVPSRGPSSARGLLPVEHFVDTRDGGFLESGTVDVAIVRLVSGEIHPLGGVGDRHFLIMQRLRLLPEIPQKRLEVVDLLLAFERFAVAWNRGL